MIVVEISEARPTAKYDCPTFFRSSGSNEFFCHSSRDPTRSWKPRDTARIGWLILFLEVAAFLTGMPAVFAQPSQPSAALVIQPATLKFEGAMNGSSFQRLLSIEAKTEVADIHLKAHVLRAQGSDDSWIGADKVVVSPSQIQRLQAGERVDVEVRLSGVPGAGIYEGDIRMNYTRAAPPDAKPVEERQSIPIKVDVRAADSDLGISPQVIEVNGVVGVSSFKQDFTIEAVGAVSALTFAPSDLKDQTGESWISASQVSLTPQVPSLAAGERRQLVVTVAGINAAGHYEGQISVRYGQPVQTATIRLVVEAAKIIAVPPELALDYEKAGLFGGGSGALKRPLLLQQEADRPSSPFWSQAASNLVARIGPLQNTQKKSEVLQPQLAVRQEPTGTFNLSFDTPEAMPGTYTGKLWLRSPELGRVAEIPVEIKVRASERTAWVWMLIGILVSWGVTYWKTTGKKRNTLQLRLQRMEDRLQRAEVTRQSRLKLQNLLQEMREKLKLDEFQTVETKAAAWETMLTAAVDVKLALAGKARRLKLLKEPLEELETRLADIVPAGVPVLDYLKEIREEWNGLIEKINLDVYPKADDAELQKAITALKEHVTGLGGLSAQLKELLEVLDLLNEIYVKSFQTEIKGKLKEKHLSRIEGELAKINDATDVGQVKQRIETTHAQLAGAEQIIDSLARCREEMERAKDAGKKMEKSSEQLRFCRDYFELRGEIPRQAEVDKLASLISNESGSKKLPEDSVTTTSLQGRHFRPLASGNELIALVFGEEETAGGGRVEVNLWGRLKAWWTPQRVQWVVGFMLYIVALAILLPIGMSQTYWNSATFGSTTGGLEYLAVFLWGFGIQTSTATAASVLQSIRGS